MDRLNQLRGDSGASRDCTLETTSLLGETYMTANDGSKYFSVTEDDSSATDSPSKKAADDVTADSPLSHAERNVLNLSPIPKNNELDNFKIGEQIEAANILSGGVNIFDDYENSYDGDELVIDDAVTEGDDKPSEIKLGENIEETFEKAEASVADPETVVPSKDTEVVLQINGNNVGAIDIGNGIYLYRKDGEEELAAVQVLDDNHQQPDIKFLKVRENAEGNLEVYEEIEIEVPKEVPTKEGKAVKNTSHITVKDVNKDSEHFSNKIAENKCEAVSKDIIINAVELDMNKDNAHIESRTEVNLNGKMIKIGESRKSPLIGTFTPMTYHSTPNKEGIPLTKTMVDLQLHPNRHSENVKKTIEVHTDNCKQRLLETPTKITRDSNECIKNSEPVSSSKIKDKDLSNDTIGVGADTSPENNKDSNKLLLENKTYEIDDDNEIEKVIMVDNKPEGLKTKVFAKNNIESNVTEDKDKVRDVKTSSLLSEIASAALGAECKSNTKLFSEVYNVKPSKIKASVDEKCESILRNDLLETKTSDVSQSQNAEELHDQSSESKYIKVNNDITTENGTIVRKMENDNINNDMNRVQNAEVNTENVIPENPNRDDIIPSNTLHTLAQTDKLEGVLKTSQSMSNNVMEKNYYHKRTDVDFQIKVTTNAKELDNNPVEASEISPKFYPKHDMKHINNPLEILSSSTIYDNNVHTNTVQIDSETQPMQTLKTSSDVENKEINVQPELTSSPKEMEKSRKFEHFQEKAATALRNYKSAEITTDSLLPNPKLSVNIMQTESGFKQQENECNMIISEPLEIKSRKEFQPSQNENEHLKLDNVAEVKKIENENKKNVKQDNSKCNHPENISIAVVKEDTKPETLRTTNPESKGHKESLNTEQKCNSNSLTIIESSTSEKAEVQKNHEPNQKLPVPHQNTMVSLLTSDLKLPTQKVPNEIERSKIVTKKEPARFTKLSIPKPIYNDKNAVPFGKWTEANRQDFLNKIRESKVPINTSNTKQLKQPNDLNRRDILKKIDSQRQFNSAATKVQDLNIRNKIKQKQETPAFMNKSNVIEVEKMKDKVSPSISKIEETVPATTVGDTIVLDKKLHKEHPLPVISVDMSSTSLSTKKDSVHRKEINNQDLIDKTIEGIINRAVTAKLGAEDVKQDVELVEKSQNTTSSYSPVSLDEIESKMNELHGIPFVERPPHELPKIFEPENKSVVVPDMLIANKCKLSSAIRFTNKSLQKIEHKVNHPIKNRVNEESDEEIIEHVPLTGDIQLNKNNVHGRVKDKIHPQDRESSLATKVHYDSKKEPIITENDFDKFARRNSITYENCLTVNFDGKEHHNVVQTVVERETVPKKLSRNEIMLAESKAKSHKQLAIRHSNLSSKISTATKTTQDEDSYNKNYQSKVQIAYQSAMTAKNQKERPFPMIDDKPVKVVFMDGNHEYIPHQLNVQGKELSPPKKAITECDHFTHSNSESLDSDILDVSNDSKSQDDVKFKSKHQRKQVLTPVEAPDLELIEPRDLGIEISPKKKRKIEDNRSDKVSKSLVPKKSYLLNRNITTDEAPSNVQDSMKTPLKESVNQQDLFVKHADPISAIDNLVKAAELLETQSENKHVLPPTNQNSLTQQNSPVKRGRGRPRKYPIPECGTDNKSPSPVKTPTPQKKPRLIDAKIPKHESESDDDDINSECEFVKENWTMGKINENIVCPICNKLFRSENVVFKHVKHCTGPSPSRSDSDKRSPRRLRPSQELDWKSEGSKSDSMDADEEYESNRPSKKRKSKEKRPSVDEKSDDRIDVIVIEDTPTKDRDSPISKRERLKHEQNKPVVKAKVQHAVSSLVCEFCGKTFRQLSYLVNHRLQHKNNEAKKSEKDDVHKPVFSCEICKKDFRKLHHLVQHRNIHNSNTMRSRKSSSEFNDGKPIKDARASEDQSAGFRCEPCDKSFRKLHHLVEHRETHDEINKKCNPQAVTTTVVETTKAPPLHHCDICKNTFKKLQHLIEHKEHHLDTSSEKSDDKSVKSSLSTKDIIHECSLCYMVFPNEHSLTKHYINCQRKKMESAAKQAKECEESSAAELDDETQTTDANENQAIADHTAVNDTISVAIEDTPRVVSENQEVNIIALENPCEPQKQPDLEHNEVMPPVLDVPLNPNSDRTPQPSDKLTTSTNKKDISEDNTDKISEKTKKTLIPKTTSVDKTPDKGTLSKKASKKILAKDKAGPTVTKRQRTSCIPESTSEDVSDDDDVRYMLNPNIQSETTNEKIFMNVRATKRNSLQIERPNSKDLMKRRISLQHPPKNLRQKIKSSSQKPINTGTTVKSSRSTVVPVEPITSTDSDDSDVKYSFPEPVLKEIAKDSQKKVKKTKVLEKRKSLSGIAKRKSLGKIVSAKPKVNTSPAKQIKKRVADAGHRCDCGQLFSSAALLSRHTSLAHTPPRIRRRRSPPPDNDAKPTLKRTEKPQDTRKMEPAPKKTGVTTRNSSMNIVAKPAPVSKISSSQAKTRRQTPHRGVPVPEKMKKLFEKSKK